MKKKNKKKKIEEKQDSLSKWFENRGGDALDGHGSISRWEEVNGRGFWGSSANGYIYDKDNK